jgi:KaiC/GvpD/RAD55 family RecA-like ATPase
VREADSGDEGEGRVSSADARRNTTCRDAALEYAHRGWPVFPVKGKIPRTEHGFKDATTNEPQIREWWESWPACGVGIATGAVSGLVVLDVDPRNGGDVTLEGLEEKLGPIPRTVQALTGGDGLHFYFRHPGRAVSCGSLGPGIDLKGDGGYVVAPPSPHPTGHAYWWEGSSEPGAIELAPFAWLSRALNGHGAEARAEHVRVGVEPARVLEGVAEGERDETLFRYACLLRRRGLDRAEAQTLVLNAARACKPPFPNQDALRKVEQAWRYPAGQDSQRGDADEELTWEKLPTLVDVLGAMPPPGERLSTGLTKLDRCSRGGFALGRVYTFIGPPGRGKTALVAQLALLWARDRGARVVGFFCDEGSWQAAVMMAEGVGFERDRIENAYSDLQAEVEAKAKGLDIRLPDPDDPDTILEAAERWLAGSSEPAVIVVDSAQVVRSAKVEGAKTRKECVDAVMASARRIARQRNVVVLVTSKANRSSYAHKNPADNIAAIAAGLETSSIEYASDGLFFLEGDPEIGVTLTVLKNRPGDGTKPSIRLGFNRARATFAEIDGPAAEEEAEVLEGQKRAAKLKDAQGKVLLELRQRPGQTGRVLRAKLPIAHGLVDAALDALKSAGEIRGVPGPRRAILWEVDE